jgi:polyhydroxybutyrate depolymerase
MEAPVVGPSCRAPVHLATRPGASAAAALAVLLAGCSGHSASGGATSTDIARAEAAKPISAPPASDTVTAANAPPATPGGPSAAPARGRSAGCGHRSGWPTGATSLTVNGKPRTLLVRVPPAYDPDAAHPILFAFHGAGATGAEFEPEFTLAASWRSRAILVYPTALTVTADGPTTWRRDSNDDLAFLDAMIDKLGDSLCLDRGRIFVAGFSSGGYFANTVGCRRGDRVRAVVSAAGGDHDFDDQCRGTPAVHIVIGAQDSVVPYGGAPGITNLDHAHRARDHFIAANGCRPESRPVEPAPCVEYRGCKADAPVVYCEHAGGHVWPAYLADAAAAFLKRF